ncbi:dynein axonemal intermediate chain 7 [Patella vulgata]|uniref:dynein axonemal intermediate chain 7 n=1 Tax=Patella vulgata TaxID=6465 RepID=UPI00217FEC45|nr:dynein axonemal intermediate chain 7 [Patella vulgata]
MPPKEGKKKLSKAEKDKLKKEEAEKKAQEEEEARLLAHEEEKKRKRVEMEQAEERKKQEKEEKKERSVQMKELFSILESNKSALDTLENQKRKDAKWARYMKCDGSPDPTVPGEINTYINLRLEDQNEGKSLDLLKHVEQDNALIEELHHWLSDSGDLSVNEEANYKEAIVEIQNLMSKKLDDISLQVLCNATDLQDSETYNLQYTVETANICLCIWGNLSKKRIKPFEFTEKGFTFDIPRMLSLNDCAFRILFTKYDHLSYQSSALYPKRKQKKEVPEPEPEKIEEKGSEENQDGEQNEENPEEVVEKEDTQDVMAALQNLDEEDEDAEKPAEEEKPEEPEEEDDFEDPETPEPVEWEDFDEDDDIIDLRAYHILGGVISFDLVELPPQPKQVNSWTITPLVCPPEIRKITYVADTASLTPVPKDKEGQEEKKREDKPPISISYRLPEDTMFVDEPQPGRWDPTIKHWRQDGFSDVKYDEEKRFVQFKTSYFGKIALFQDAHINMPFQSWEIRPRNVDNAILTVIAAVVDIQIEIKNDVCCLTQPSDRTEVTHLLNKWMYPSELVKAMRASGINIFPAEDSSKFVNVQTKDTLLEERIYEQMALTSSAMAYSWSKWNADADLHSIVYLGSESLNDEPLLEEDWSVYKSTKTRAMKLKTTEISDEFSDELAENTEFRSNLYHLMKITISEEGMDRIEKTDYKYIDCVQQLLQATKVLTYA